MCSDFRLHRLFLVMLILPFAIWTSNANDLPPTARIDLDPQRPNNIVYDGETIFFDGSASSDNDEGGSAITFYEWYVNGGLQSSGSAAVTFSYAFDNGIGTSQTLELRVKDDEAEQAGRGERGEPGRHESLQAPAAGSAA